MPSAFNFLYGLRPSHGRLPYGKMANSMEGQETVHSVCGPLTHSVAGKCLCLNHMKATTNWSDMRLFVKAVLAEQPWQYDSKVIPMPWRDSEAEVIKSKIGSGGLTLGFYKCDGVVSCICSAHSRRNANLPGPSSSANSSWHPNGRRRDEGEGTYHRPMEAIQARLCSQPHQRYLRF